MDGRRKPHHDISSAGFQPVELKKKKKNENNLPWYFYTKFLRDNKKEINWESVISITLCQIWSKPSHRALDKYFKNRR